MSNSVIVGIAILKSGRESVEYRKQAFGNEPHIYYEVVRGMRRCLRLKELVIGWRVERRFADGRIVVMAQTKENAS